MLESVFLDVPHDMLRQEDEAERDARFETVRGAIARLATAQVGVLQHPQAYVVPYQLDSADRALLAQARHSRES